MHRYTLVHTLKIPKFLQKEKTLKLRQCLFSSPAAFLLSTIIFALRKPPRHKWLYPSLFNLDFYAVLCLYERYTQLWWAIVCKWSWFILLHVDLKNGLKFKPITVEKWCTPLIGFVCIFKWRSELDRVYMCAGTGKGQIGQRWKLLTNIEKYGQRWIIMDKGR